MYTRNTTVHSFDVLPTRPSTLHISAVALEYPGLAMHASVRQFDNFVTTLIYSATRFLSEESVLWTRVVVWAHVLFPLQSLPP